jgi:cytochrome c peroxidase
MVSNNSNYDKYMEGRLEFNEQEINGLKIFRSRCSTCHKEPMFTDYSYRNIGLEPDTALKDSGRARITGLTADYMKFKVPTLRNIEMTYPYMHDGRFISLDQVMDHYAEKRFFTNNVDPEISNMNKLSPSEKVDLIIFLRTLTDRTFLYDKRFFDPNYSRN